jgi:hypothetical protein
MSLLVNIVIADEDDIAAIGESLQPVSEWSGLQARDIDTTKIATLHCLLTGEGFEDALSQYEPVYVSAEEGATVIRIPDELVEKLAALDEDTLYSVGEELAATEEFELSGWPEEDVMTFVEELTELAQQADANGEAMFVWMHRLLT